VRRAAIEQRISDVEDASDRAQPRSRSSATGRATAHHLKDNLPSTNAKRSSACSCQNASTRPSRVEAEVARCREHARIIQLYSILSGSQVVSGINH
jgi:hypothetical protein